MPIIVIPTDEEYMIARDTYDIVRSISQIVPASLYQANLGETATV